MSIVADGCEAQVPSHTALPAYPRNKAPKILDGLRTGRQVAPHLRVGKPLQELRDVGRTYFAQRYVVAFQDGHNAPPELPPADFARSYASGRTSDGSGTPLVSRTPHDGHLGQRH